VSRRGEDPPRWAPDPATYADGVLDGTWDYPLHDGEDRRFLRRFRADYGKPFNGASIRIGFDGPYWWQGVVVDGKLAVTNGEKVGAVGVTRIDGGKLTITGPGWVSTFRWTLDGNELSLRLVKDCDRDSGTCATTQDGIEAIDPLTLEIVDHTFTKSGSDASY
jgi:hypothetical protein